VWDRAIGAVAEAYDELIASGMPSEDARGILPHAVLTRVHYCTDLRALLDHAGNRLSVQAQFEWRAVFAAIREAIRGSDAYMADEIAEMLLPVCFQTGKCEFNAEFDRHCDIRERVEAYHKAGVPSSDWEGGRADLGIEAIKPYDWLGDPNAARP
jgi:thymidylate synthase ThyX